MKRAGFWLLAFCALLSIVFTQQSFAKPQDGEDRTLSPYFFVNSDNPDADRLPLKSTKATVNISGVIADMLVTQVYKNDGRRPLEAVYVFPASTRAAVYSMKMTIGKRVIEAKIKKRDEARREYEQAREAGKNASLLEQQRPNVFQMNVANIMPGDEIKVELRYTELLVPTDCVYEFVYPTVVGPRYSNQKAAGASPSEHWVENPYLHQGELSATTFDINVLINAGMPIKDLACSSHKVNAVYENQAVAKVSLDKAEVRGGNRDYILRYRLDGDKIQTGLLLFQGARENFFVLMTQPPRKITNAGIPGREYIFIVDVSGSMRGFPLNISKKLLSDLISNLRETDRFNVLLFSGGSSLMAEESLPATRENIQKAVDTIERQRGGGGTELLPALHRALSLKKKSDFSRTVVIVTDGYVRVEEEAFDLIRKNLNNANMFAFGIGTSVNRHLIEGMARVGMGEPFIITRPDAAQAQAQRFRKMIQSPVLTQVKVGFSGFNTYDVEPLSVPDVLAERPVLVFGKWRGNAGGTVKVSGVAGGGRYAESIKVENYKASKENAALKYLWARHRITLLSDYNRLGSNNRRIQEITELALKYNLLTAYTSFVAVDNQVRNVDGKWTTVKQPLPLPEGVSDSAVGSSGRYPAAPVAHRTWGMGLKMHGKMSADKMEVREAEVSEKNEGAQNISFTDVVTEKGLTKNEISTVVLAQTGEIKKCLAGLKTSGTIKLRFIVNPDGTVKKAEVISCPETNTGFRKCLIDRVKKWVFPATKNKKEVTVSLSIVIS